MKPFVIAEVGSNFTCREHLFESAFEAKKAGADAVKYQFFTMQDLFGPWTKRVHNHELTDRDVRDLAKYCEHIGIEFMCTGFSAEAYAFLNPFVYRHKVASCEMMHKGILDKLLELKRPVIVSTGAHIFEEIKRMRDYLMPLAEKGYLTLLYCSVVYPTTEVDLSRLLKLSELGCPVGFSDHTTDINIPIIAHQYFFAQVIEKHVKLLDKMDTPDNSHSVSFKELREMILGMQKPLKFGLEHFGRTESDMSTVHEGEIPARNTWRRRIVAKEDIKVGDILTPFNCGIYRLESTFEGGLDGLAHFVGRVAEKGFKRGEPITL